ncbi:MAG: asparagine synthase (glutamine-hydrolyzing) [Cyanobacteria bacterium]|nr:asparagine synthase (glutamine-hydrolyzing) [Cyanobacteriota bacterium]
MCGIFGLFPGKTPPSHWTIPRLARCVELLRHRGPDAQALRIFLENGSSEFLDLQQTSAHALQHSRENNSISGLQVALGHTRLSIIDRSNSANQPMAFHQGGYWLVFNGEIYNFQALRAQCEQQGLNFITSSDSEVLLGLYHLYGPTMVQQLNGMFAFAIWDRPKNKLFLARDRFGIKPMYIRRFDDGGLAFASELKSLMALDNHPPQLDYTALWDYFTFQNVLDERTWVTDIQCFPPGKTAHYRLETGELTYSTYWSPNFQVSPEFLTADYSQPSSQITPSETTLSEYRDLFQEAVTRQLVGEVPMGSLLSGGMDTGAITQAAVISLPGMPTFTAGFDTRGASGVEALFDERPEAAMLASQLKTRHAEIEINAEALSTLMPTVMWSLDDPRVGISYQNLLINQRARQDVTVLLSGVGGDELFAGYPWRYQWLMQPEAAELDSLSLTKKYYQHWTRLLSDQDKQQFFSARFCQELGNPSDQQELTWQRFQAKFVNTESDLQTHPLHRALSFDIQTFLHGLLIVEDRLSMAVGLETRVPFLDHNWVDRVMTLPASWRITQDGQSKWVLKQIFSTLLPPEVLNRRKQGFTPPEAHWFRHQSKPYLKSILDTDRFFDRQLVTREGFTRTWDAHMADESGTGQRFLLWSMLCLEWWHRLFVDDRNWADPRFPY